MQMCEPAITVRAHECYTQRSIGQLTKQEANPAKGYQEDKESTEEYVLIGPVVVNLQCLHAWI